MNLYRIFICDSCKKSTLKKYKLNYLSIIHKSVCSLCNTETLCRIIYDKSLIDVVNEIKNKEVLDNLFIESIKQKKSILNKIKQFFFSY